MGVRGSGRTFSRARWLEADAAWREGGFDPSDWREVRLAAARSGMLYPPAGSRQDSWDDESPSQRAIVYRALVETPAMLLATIARSSSWSAVVEALIHSIAELREDAARREADDARRRGEVVPSRMQAAERLGDIMRRAAR